MLQVAVNFIDDEYVGTVKMLCLAANQSEVKLVMQASIYKNNVMCNPILY